jgi:succinate-acetate transporter protein
MSDMEKQHLPLNGSRAPRPSTIANPGCLGLFSFASTTFILSMYNVAARDVHTANAVVGMALFCGGLAQLLAGMWEFPRGNVLGASAFTSYGAFWMSFGTINLPGSGIIAAYTSKKELSNAIGIYLIAWFMVTFFFLLATFRKAVSFVALFGFLAITFLVLAIGEFTASSACHTAGGALGIVTAFIAYYIGVSELLGNDSLFALPLGSLA